MFEIELKAHVEDWESVEEKLKTFAEFVCHVQRNDTYYKMTKEDGETIKVRIREEIDFTNNKKRIFMTYKHKEMQKTTDGTAFEVNEEKECEISDHHAMEAFLFATGFSIDITKLKGVYDYKYNEVLCELCTIPPLGDFLELEILVNEDEAERNPVIVEEARKKLAETLEKAGLGKDKIEERFYSEMLRNAKSGE